MSDNDNDNHKDSGNDSRKAKVPFRSTVMKTGPVKAAARAQANNARWLC